MTNEDKELLLKDFGGRLQYGVKMDVDGNVHTLSGIIGNHVLEFDETFAFYGWASFTFKPYLRPISSMTEEEKKELSNIRPYLVDKNDNIIGVQCNSFIQTSECQDWLNAHHFDYRGLIPMGLALEALEYMYKYKGES